MLLSFSICTVTIFASWARIRRSNRRRSASTSPLMPVVAHRPSLSGGPRRLNDGLPASLGDGHAIVLSLRCEALSLPIEHKHRSRPPYAGTAPPDRPERLPLLERAHPKQLFTIGGYPDWEERAQILAMRARGLTFRQIGEALGVSRQSAHQVFWRAVRDLRRRRTLNGESGWE